MVNLIEIKSKRGIRIAFIGLEIIILCYFFVLETAFKIEN